MNIFLRLKAWQTFLVLVGIPFGFNFLLMSTLISSEQPDPELIFKVMPLFMLLFMGVFLFWFWSLGVGLNNQINEELRPKVKFFKFGVIYAGSYMVLFQVLFVFSMGSGGPGGAMAFIFPLHLFAMYCMFYSIYFIAKNLVTYEQQKPVKFSSFSGPFFLLWFFPIGIWFIQPRINKIYAAENT